eukprot:jgi/Botrbrau1/11715/Bobra.0195s0043.1
MAAAAVLSCLTCLITLNLVAVVRFWARSDSTTCYSSACSQSRARIGLDLCFLILAAIDALLALLLLWCITRPFSHEYVSWITSSWSSTKEKQEDVEAGKLPIWGLGFPNYQQRLRPMVSRIKQALREAEDLRLGSTGSSGGTASTGGGFSDAPTISCNMTPSWRPHRLESTTGTRGGEDVSRNNSRSRNLHPPSRPFFLSGQVQKVLSVFQKALP